MCRACVHPRSGCWPSHHCARSSNRARTHRRNWRRSGELCLSFNPRGAFMSAPLIRISTIFVNPFSTACWRAVLPSLSVEQEMILQVLGYKCEYIPVNMFIYGSCWLMQYERRMMQPWCNHGAILCAWVLAYLGGYNCLPVSQLVNGLSGRYTTTGSPCMPTAVGNFNISLQWLHFCSYKKIV